MSGTEQLEAGPELDALVAEHVMGLKRHDWQEYLSMEFTVVCSECGQTKKKGTRDRLNCWCKVADGPREFSTDTAWAWYVLDELDKDWRISLHQMWDGKTWQCTLEPMESLAEGMAIYPRVVKRSIFANADTPNLAICRAALQTVAKGGELLQRGEGAE